MISTSSFDASRWFTLLFVTVFFALGSTGSWAQKQAVPPQRLSTAKLEQLVAPIALHPDALLSQIMMASTYPLEVVEAARWVTANPKITDKSLEEAMLKQSWDPSVKSLTAFPQVLQMMNDQLSWMQQLGDAFLAQQKDLLDAVQALRAKAAAQGKLATTKKQKVKTQTIKVDTGKQHTVIIIEPSDPKVIYVPAYDPTIVYGTWPYAAYPPYYWYPPGYVARRVLWFGAGIVYGHALWGRYDWRRRSVAINVSRYNSFNRTRISNARWQHNPIHRRAVPYRNPQVAARYGKGARDTRSREKFRGRAEAGRRDLATKRPGGDRRPGAGKRPGAEKRPKARKKSTARKSAARKRPKGAAKKRARTAKRSRPAKRPTAYRGMGKGKQVRRHSARGQRSRVATRSRGGGRARGGGGRSRGGGGRRGGGRRR